MLAPSSCKGPSTHSCLNIYLRHEGGGGGGGGGGGSEEGGERK